MLHVVKGLHPVILEDGVVLGHRVVAQGCLTKRGALLGIGSVVLDGVKVGEESIVGAGSVVSPGRVIPPRTLAMGTPARAVHSLKEDDVKKIRDMVEEYRELTELYMKSAL